MDAPTGMAEGQLLLLFTDLRTSQWLEQTVLLPAGYRTIFACDRASAEAALNYGCTDLILTGEAWECGDLQPFVKSLLQSQPQIPMILVQEHLSEKQVIEAFHCGFADVLQLPCTGEAVLAGIKKIIKKRQRLADYAAISAEKARLDPTREPERSKLETILAQLENGMILLDPDDRVRLINQSARQALRIQDKPLTGKPLQDVVLHQDLLEILSEGNRETAFQAEIILEDSRVMAIQITPVPEAGTAILMQDITTLKELDRIKSDFVNTVSHDLRSPLTAILGYVELIERTGPTNEQQREFIRRIQLSVNSITALINDLLDLGRIEAGFDSRKEAVLLDMIVQYAVENCKIRAAEKRQTLVVDLSPDSASVLGNPIHLHQMVSNLINNAVNYTPTEGSIKVQLREEDNQLILNVSDNGPGIPPGDLPHIFDKFYRGSNVPIDSIGSGLGLAIVKSIVDNHQGRIWVNSSLGTGSSFTVVLPVTDQLR